MATEFVGIPNQLMTKVKEAADREEISVEELARGAVERRLDYAEWMHTLHFGERNAATDERPKASGCVQPCRTGAERCSPSGALSLPIPIDVFLPFVQ